jgi:Kef-type K+ transport system membrane component KefB
MFVIGMELDLKILKHKAKDAVVISHASIIFPHWALALPIFSTITSLPPVLIFYHFPFLGIAMSITAFRF